MSLRLDPFWGLSSLSPPNVTISSCKNLYYVTIISQRRWFSLSERDIILLLEGSAAKAKENPVPSGDVDGFGARRASRQFLAGRRRTTPKGFSLHL